MTKEFKIGLAATLAIFMLYWGANFLSGNDVFSPDNGIYAKYQNLDGLTSASGVTYKGMRVGSVKGIEFDSSATDGYCWVVKFEVSTEGIYLMDSCVAEISSADLLGTMVVELSKIDKGLAPVKVRDTIVGKLSPTLQEEVDKRLAPLEAQVKDLISKSKTLVETFNTVLDDGTQTALKRSFTQIPTAMNNISHATSSLDSIVTNLKNAKLEKIVNNIADLTTTLNKNSSKITSILKNLDNMTDSLAKSDVKQTIGRVNSVLSETEVIMTKINNGEGTVGQLLNDKQLYENLILATADLDLLLLDLKQNPGRYLNVSLLNFGSKRQKDPEVWDSSSVEVLKDNLGLINALHVKEMSSLEQELKDSCGATPCDSATVRRIFEKHK